MSNPKQYYLPLPKEIRGAFTGDILFDGTKHGGLLWTRFFNGYAEDFSKTLEIKEEKDKNRTKITEAQNGKSDFVLKFNKTTIAVNATKLAERIGKLVCSLDGEAKIFSVNGSFMTGLGNDHPTENGFTWHHTLGVPYLPASSVKGLVRGWLEWNCDETALKKEGGDAEKRQQLKNWFGSENKDPRECDADSQAGWFIFFDALPTDAVTLAADVMTPHYDKWYEKGGGDNPLATDTVPADWHSPIPVTFLTVKKAAFQFGIAVRPSLAAAEKDKAQAALCQVMAQLQEALEWFGAGAKTAVGYGRMKFDQEKMEALAREQAEQVRLAALANMSNNQREVAELAEAIVIRKEQLRGSKEKQNGDFHSRAKKLVEAAKAAGNWTEAEKSALKDLVTQALPQVVENMSDAKEQRKRFKLNDL